MKTLLISGFIALAGLLSTELIADTYVAELNGVECEGCKKTIAKSLTKLQGVEVIRIEKLGDEKHKMTVTTDGSAPITQEQAVAAIAHAEHYTIKSWSKSTEDPKAHPHADEKPVEIESWLVNGWDNLLGTWEQEDGPTFTFKWKFPGTVLENHVKWGESEKYAVLWKQPETGEISILSLDNKGGQSKGTCHSKQANWSSTKPISQRTKEPEIKWLPIHLTVITSCFRSTKESLAFWLENKFTPKFL